MRVVPLIKERLVKLADARELVAFLTEADAEVAALYDAAALVPKGRSLADAAAALQAARDALARADRGRLRGGRSRGALP